jgi:N-acetylglutamate synthase-like GNAT family acetyltransferase
MPELPSALVEPEGHAQVRPAAPQDRPTLAALLAAAHLPTDGVVDGSGQFVVAVHSGEVVGGVGVEHYGEQALLRSLVVAPEHRGIGLGVQLGRRAIEVAGAMGCDEVVLLTTTAEGFFSRLGFRSVTRDQITGPITAAAELTGLRPDTASVLLLALRGTRTA